MRKVGFALVFFSLWTALCLPASPVRADGADAAAPPAAEETPDVVAMGVGVLAERAASHDAEEAQAERMLRRAYAARWERPVRYQEVRTIFSAGSSETVVRRIWWRPPASLRVEEEHDHGRRTLLWNEHGQWLYDSRFPYVLHIEGSRPTLPRGTPRLGAAFRPSLSREAWSTREVTGPGGRRMDLIERRLPDGGGRWWIDRDHGFPWKEEYFGRDGEPAAVIIRTDVEFDADLGDDVFEFEVPAGVEVLTDAGQWRQRVIVHGVRAEAPFGVALPVRLPPRFSLVAGRVTELNGKPAVHWQFFDGEKVLSLFQLPEETASRRREPALTVMRQDDTLVVSAVRRGHRFFVVGDVTVEDAQEMLDSLEDIE